MLTRRRLITLSAAAFAAPNVTGSARGQQAVVGWPTRAVHLIVPIAAGGPTDSVARILAEQLSKMWGREVVVENKSGAGTNVGSEYVARAEADGYTALYGTSSLAANAALYRSLGYNAMTDLAPVSLVAKFPFFMFVPNSSPAKTLSDFIDDVKAHPGRRVMGSPGTGSGPHLAEEYFLQMAKLQMTHAPYRGAAPAFIDLIPGRIDCYFGSGELLTYSRSGQVRALAMTGAKRSAAEPDLPTIAEAGLPGYQVESWQGVFLPAKTSPDIVRKMSTDIAAALAQPEIKNKLANAAYAAQSSSPQELGTFLKADTAKWADIIKTAGIKID